MAAQPALLNVDRLVNSVSGCADSAGVARNRHRPGDGVVIEVHSGSVFGKAHWAGEAVTGQKSANGLAGSNEGATSAS